MPKHYHLKPDITLESHPDHWLVGHLLHGHNGIIYFVESHDAEGWNLYPTNGSGEWINISDMAVNRTFWETWPLEIGGPLFSQYGRVPGWEDQPKHDRYHNSPIERS